MKSVITRRHTRTEVWAQILLSEKDQALIREFFVNEIGIKRRLIVSKMHLTIYHSRRPMIGVTPFVKDIKLILPTSETRFMVLAPGGENPRPDLEPRERKVGIRVRRQSKAMDEIMEFRDLLLKYESKKVLGLRLPSTKKRNAFGAAHFQPHVALIKAGSSLDRELSKVGALFRRCVGTLTFDKFAIDVTRKLVTGVEERIHPRDLHSS